MNKKIVNITIGLILVLGLIGIGLNTNSYEYPSFDKCENAKYFGNGYNPDYYNEDSSKFYNEIKLSIIKECKEELNNG